jgi:S1-C subfamily serine protease
VLAGVAFAALILLGGIGSLAALLWTRGTAKPAAGGGAEAAEIVPGAPAGSSMTRAVLDDIKNSTVFVKVDAGSMAGSGSGFVIRKDGNSAYIVTNHHVITPPADANPMAGFRPFPGPRFPLRPGFPSLRRQSAPVITLVFRSNTAQERTAPATVLLNDAARDLAVLQVTGVEGLPAPITLVRNPQLVETMPVFLFGFPFGDALAFDSKNPAITVGKGSVSSIRLNEQGLVARIQIDGDLNPGNSGGPVVDAQGRLVGVAVAKIKNTHIGLAIPPGELITMLESAAKR